MFSNLIFLIFYTSLVSSQRWNYQDQTTWARDFTSCGGSRQSPINIDSNRVQSNPALSLDLIGYDDLKSNVILTNDGHSARLNLNPRSLRPIISGSAVGSDVYTFENMHFHWGNNNLRGTEHSVDEVFGSAEIHFVHYNQKYRTFSGARDRPDGVAVLTILIQLDRNPNIAIEPIIRSLRRVTNFNSSHVIPVFNFGQVFPTDRQTFFRYSGSLTTPPCSETATFIIFAQPIGIDTNQLSQFRRILEEPMRGRSNERLVSNVRDIQRRNGRVVEVSVTARVIDNTDELDDDNNFDYFK